MAPYRALEINLVSASDLKDVNLLSKMDVYVVVSLCRDGYWYDHANVKSTVHRNGGRNPTWNFRLAFIVDEALARQDRLTLDFNIKAEGFGGDKDVGLVKINVKNLLDSSNETIVDYQVFRPSSGRLKGMLSLWCKFGEEMKEGLGTRGVHQGPAPPPGSGWGYPPQPQGQQIGCNFIGGKLLQMLDRVRFWLGLADLASDFTQYSPLNDPTVPFDIGADSIY